MAAALVFGVACFIALSPSESQAEDQRQGGFQVPEGIGITQELGARVPGDLTFRDEHGRTVQLQDYFGEKPILLQLVYLECPMLCNLSSDGLIHSLTELKQDVGADFEVLTVSFDPREGPKLAAAAKKTAVRRYGRDGADAGWHFLTGKEPEIRKLADTVGFTYEYDEKTEQYAHAAGLMVLTPDGTVSRYLYGVEYRARDLRLSLVEASAGEIGSLTDQILLLCYHYNPITGRYGLAIVSALRIAGVATVILIGGGIVTMLRRERQNQSHAAEASTID
ncbi:MAG: SCO family protein [Pirellulales bacterium]